MNIHQKGTPRQKRDKKNVNDRQFLDLGVSKPHNVKKNETPLKNFTCQKNL